LIRLIADPVISTRSKVCCAMSGVALKPSVPPIATQAALLSMLLLNMRSPEYDKEVDRMTQSLSNSHAAFVKQ
jgi:hypothetical protein